MAMLAKRFESRVSIGDKDLRKQIDRSVSRALVDRNFATELLSDPTVALEEHGCSPAEYRSLRSIHALDLVDFAQQVHALFWLAEPAQSSLEAAIPLAAAASV